MRRFACHYLYVSADGCYSKYVVELEDSDRVRAYFPLKEEISATQWIGGVIIISPMYELDICSERNLLISCTVPCWKQNLSNLYMHGI